VKNRNAYLFVAAFALLCVACAKPSQVAKEAKISFIKNIPELIFLTKDTLINQLYFQVDYSIPNGSVFRLRGIDSPYIRFLDSRKIDSTISFELPQLSNTISRYDAERGTVEVIFSKSAISTNPNGGVSEDINFGITICDKNGAITDTAIAPSIKVFY
jgi:hypothetical protein